MGTGEVVSCVCINMRASRVRVASAARAAAARAPLHRAQARRPLSLPWPSKCLASTGLSSDFGACPRIFSSPHAVRGSTRVTAASRHCAWPGPAPRAGGGGGAARGPVQAQGLLSKRRLRPCATPPVASFAHLFARRLSMDATAEASALKRDSTASDSAGGPAAPAHASIASTGQAAHGWSLAAIEWDPERVRANVAARSQPALAAPALQHLELTLTRPLSLAAARRQRTVGGAGFGVAGRAEPGAVARRQARPRARSRAQRGGEAAP
jgi:hypothetical protein